MLLKYPLNISLLVLTTWCEIRDLVGIDSAFCNLKNRKELLELFALEFFILQDLILLTEQNMTWIQMRQIQFEKVKICWLISNSLANFNLSKICHFELGIGICPHDIHYDGVNANDILQQMINSMPRITSLSIVRVRRISFRFILGVNKNKLNQLTSLKYISVFDQVTCESIDYITKNCVNIVSMDLGFYDKQVENPDNKFLSLLLRKKLQIQYLEIYPILDVAEFLRQVMIFIPRIKSLVIKSTNTQTESPSAFDEFRVFLEKCTFTEKLSIEYAPHVNIRYQRNNKHHNCPYEFRYNGTSEYTLPRVQVNSLTKLIKSLHISLLELWAVNGLSETDYLAILCERTDLKVILVSGRSMCESLQYLTTIQLQSALYGVASKLPSLTIIFHPTITTDSVNAILLTNPQLINYYFFECPRVDSNKLIRASENLL